MRSVTRPLASLLAVTCLVACSGTPEPVSATSLNANAERDPYTRYEQVANADGTVVGYVVHYDEVPLYADVDRAIPPGCVRIQDPQFVDIGFLTANGELRRFETSKVSRAMGSYQLNDALEVLFEQIDLVRTAMVASDPRWEAIRAEDDAHARSERDHD